MNTVYIHHNAAPAQLAAVQATIEHEQLYNPDWNGAEFEIERDDCTWIDTDNQIAGAQLLNLIRRAIDAS